MVFQPEGADRVFRVAIARAGLRTAQHTLTRRVIQIPFFVSGRVGVIPAYQIIQAIVGKGGRGTAAAGRGTGGHVAPAIVAGAIGLRLAARRRAGGAWGVETGQLMRLIAVAVEILVRARAIVRALPQLAQVHVDILVAVGGSAEAVGGRTSATGAVAGSLWGAGVTCPDQSVLLVVATCLIPNLVDGLR